MYTRGKSMGIPVSIPPTGIDPFLRWEQLADEANVVVFPSRLPGLILFYQVGDEIVREVDCGFHPAYRD